MPIWCVIATPDCWIVTELSTTARNEVGNYTAIVDGLYYSFEPDDLLAIFDSKEEAQAALERGQAKERELRPMWQFAAEHESRMRNFMMNAALMALRGK